VVSGFYVVAVAAASPMVGYGIATVTGGRIRFPGWMAWYATWHPWLWIAILAAGPLILLFVHVDTRERQLVPKRHLAWTVAATALAAAVLLLAMVSSLMVAVLGDKAVADLLGYGSGAFFTVLGVPGTSAGPGEILLALAPVAVVWLVCGAIFYRFRARLLDRKTRPYRLLVKGSVAELLIAVPSHALISQRDQCCAPMVSAYGIATGLAILFMSFGPGVWFLFEEQMRRMNRRR